MRRGTEGSRDGERGPAVSGAISVPVWTLVALVALYCLLAGCAVNMGGGRAEIKVDREIKLESEIKSEIKDEREGRAPKLAP